MQIIGVLHFGNDPLTTKNESGRTLLRFIDPKFCCHNGQNRSLMGVDRITK
jgi:hypothetical protein